MGHPHNKYAHAIPPSTPHIKRKYSPLAGELLSQLLVIHFPAREFLAVDNHYRHPVTVFCSQLQVSIYINQGKGGSMLIDDRLDLRCHPSARPTGSPHHELDRLHLLAFLVAVPWLPLTFHANTYANACRKSVTHTNGPAE